MRKLIRNELNNVAGGNFSEDCTEAFESLQSKCKDLGYKVSDGWDSFKEAVKEYGSENVPFYTVHSATGEEDYIVFAVPSIK